MSKWRTSALQTWCRSEAAKGIVFFAPSPASSSEVAGVVAEVGPGVHDAS